MKKITIFTPTYNRAYILERCYKSLVKQTNKKFEWLIVDDGSTDNTKEIVQGWINEGKIDIRYFYQKNQGKMIAHNNGVLNARYELFFCLDSDDYLTSNCVEELIDAFIEIENDEKVTGIIAKKNFINKKNNAKFPNIKYVTLMDLKYKYRYNSDLLLAYKTKILKRFLFPKIEGEKFIPEPYVYDQIDQIGKMILLNKSLNICEYLEDGYTNNIKRNIRQNANGYILFAKQEMMLTNNIRIKCINAIRYIMGNWIIRERKYIKKIDGLYNKMIVIMILPIALIAYIKKYK